MRRIVAAALCMIAFALLLPVAQAQKPVGTPAQAELPGEFMGMVVRDPHYEWNTNPAYAGTNKAFYEAMGANLQLAGVKWVRIEFFAEEAAPTNGATDMRGRVDLAKYDYFINTVAPKYGFKVIGLLATPLVRQRPAGDPAFYPDDPKDPTDTYGPGAYIKPEDIEDGLTIKHPTYDYVNPYMRLWLDNAFDVARRFPYNATTGAGVAAFEVLNEENRYLNGGGKGMNPLRVADMLTKFYRIYKNVQCPGGQIGGDCSATKILLGGLHPDRCDDCKTTTTPNGMTDRQYLDTIYKSAAFQGYRSANARYPVDGIGYHPYPMEIKNELLPEISGINELNRVPQRMRDIRAVMNANGDSANKIWVTEVGDRGAPADVDNQRRQSDFMRSIYYMLWQERAYVQTVLWFKYEDFAVPSNPNAVGSENWGVVRLVPRTPTADCPTCEYDPNGSVQVYKESYTTFLQMATTGEGLQVMSRLYMPITGKGTIATP